MGPTGAGDLGKVVGAGEGVARCDGIDEQYHDRVGHIPVMAAVLRGGVQGVLADACGHGEGRKVLHVLE